MQEVLCMQQMRLCLNRSSRPDVFCKNGVLRNFTKFTGKHLCQSLVFNKVACLRPATLLKKRLWDRCFPVNFVKFPRTFLHRTPLVAASALRFFFILNWKYRRNDRVTISHALPKVTMALFLVNLVWTLSLYTKPLTR